MVEEATEIASCSSAPEPPNRDGFERSLSELNEQISNVSEEIRNFHNETCSEQLRHEKLVLLDDLDKTKKQLEIHKPLLENMKKTITAKENQITEMENDLIYKDEEKLRACLEDFEKNYQQRSFTSIRDEQLWVKRLDTFRRNYDKLTKYNLIIEEKRILTEEYNMEKCKQKSLFKDKRAISDKLSKIRQRTEFSKRRIADLKSNLKELVELRKNLIEDYNSKKEAYSLWSRNQKKKLIGTGNIRMTSEQSYPATFPAARRNQQKGRYIDEEEQLLEPFFEYKTTCRRLITYLESLQLQVENVEKRGPVAEDENDSADEFPSSFLVLRKHESAPANTRDCYPSKSLFAASVLKKRANKRSTKKPTQSINHQLEFIHLFDEIHVELPVCYQQVPKVLEKVRSKLEACKEQTNIVIWNESDYQNMAVPSDSSGDSYCVGSADMSEVSSVGGSFVAPSFTPGS